MTSLWRNQLKEILPTAITRRHFMACAPKKSPSFKKVLVGVVSVSLLVIAYQLVWGSVDLDSPTYQWKFEVAKPLERGSVLEKHVGSPPPPPTPASSQEKPTTALPTTSKAICASAFLPKYPKHMFRPDLPSACEENGTYVASPAFCPPSTSPPFFLLFIMSKADNFNLRYGQRSLLLRSRLKMSPEFVDQNRWRYLFVVGRAKGSATEKIQRKIEAEACHFKDILQVDVLEDYYNLTRKKMAAFDYLFQRRMKFEILLKTDDDCFINVQTILEWLRSVTPAAYKNAISLLKNRGTSTPESVKYFFAGACRLAATPNRDRNSKWYLSKEVFSPEVFPPICNGAGYFLSYDLVAAMVALPGDQMRSFRLEDVHTAILVNRTGLVAKEAVIITKRVAILDTYIDGPVCIKGQFPTVVISMINDGYPVFQILLDHFLKSDTCT